MKKSKIFILTLIFIFNLCLTVFAQEVFLNINVNGNLKKGSEIDIIINAENIERLYAGDIRFNFDKESMEILSFKSGKLINNKDINKLEFGGDIDKSKSDWIYQFTCTGKVQGFSGSGELVIIKAKILKDINPLAINNERFKIQLCERSEQGKIEFINYKVKNNKQTDITANKVDKEEPNNKNLFNRIKNFFMVKDEKKTQSLNDAKIKEFENNKFNIDAKNNDNKNINDKIKPDNKKQPNQNNADKTDLDKKNNTDFNQDKDNLNKEHKQSKKLQSENNKTNKGIAIILIILGSIITVIYYKNKK